jgi:hypothetical protein
MEQTSGKIKKSLGYKPAMRALNPNEELIFPRERFATIRNTISLLKVEHPDRVFQYEVVEDGIRVVCLK